MAKLSRNARHKAKTKRTLSQTRKQLRAMNRAYFNAMSTLLMVLAQKGGEVTVTQGTMQQTIQNLQRLSWRADPSPTDVNEFVVRLIEEEQPASTEPVEELSVEENTLMVSPHSDATGYVAPDEPFPGSSEVTEQPAAEESQS